MTRWRRCRVVLIPLVAIVGLYVAAMAYRVYVRQYYLFLPDYVRWTISPPATVDGPTHVFVLLAGLERWSSTSITAGIPRGRCSSTSR